MRPAGDAAGLEGLIGRRIVGVSWCDSEGGVGLRLRFSDRSAFALLVDEGRPAFKWLSGIEGALEQYIQNCEEFSQFLKGHQFQPCNLPRDADVFKFNYEMCHLFIDLWSQAGSSPQYVKAEWGHFGEMLDALGIYPESSVWGCSPANEVGPPG